MTAGNQVTVEASVKQIGRESYVNLHSYGYGTVKEYGKESRAKDVTEEHFKCKK